MSSAIATYEDTILSGLEGSLTPQAAESLLTLSFSAGQQQRMRELAELARQGVLTDEQRREADSFERVSSFLGIVHSQARISLKTSSP
jgi:hypothetical protein